MKIFKKITLFTILFIIYFTICAINYSYAIVADISDSIFRLHVIANSDTLQDQNLKYKVRDSILDYMNTLTDNNNTKEEITKIVSSHLEDFKKIAEETIYENGYDYPVTIEIGKFKFPTKTYGDISFPSGFYDALRIKIGKAEGQNWWCVMFPPLCFIDVSSGIVPEDSKEVLESELSEEEFNLISENDSKTKVKFKIVEVLQNFNFSGIFM